MQPDDNHALIPAYNAAPFVGDVIRQASVHAPVLVVNDGSTDGTLDAARRTDARVIGAAVFILLLCACVALLMPVRRATRVDPITVLR